MSNGRLETESRKTEIKGTIGGGVLGAEKPVCLLWPWLSLASALCLPSPGDMLHKKEMTRGHLGGSLCCCVAGGIVLGYWQSNFQLRVNPHSCFQEQWGRPRAVLIGMGREDIVGIITAAPQGWASSVLAAGAQPVLADTQGFYQLPEFSAAHSRPALPQTCFRVVKLD